MRADIEAIRGVHCGETLRLLMEKGLVKIAGRRRFAGPPGALRDHETVPAGFRVEKSEGFAERGSAAKNSSAGRHGIASTSAGVGAVMFVKR